MKTQELARLLRKRHRLCRSWGIVASEFGISKALAYRIAKDGYDPSDPQLREQLSLSPKPCTRCGQRPHHKHAPRPRSIQDTPPALLRWQLEHREEIPT